MGEAGPEGPRSGLRLTRLPREAGVGPMWQVAGEPFRIMHVGPRWLLIGIGDDARDLLARHDLLAREFPTAAALVSALANALAHERGTRGTAPPDQR